MAIQSTTYPVFEYERKPKGRRRRRISVLAGYDSILWYPIVSDYYHRVIADGGTVEALNCVNIIVGDLMEPTPIQPIVYTHVFTVGNSSQNYGFQGGAYGAIVPNQFEGDEIISLRVSIADNNVLFGLLSGQLAGVSVVNINFEGFSIDDVPFNWSINAYKSLNPTLTQFFIDNLGNDINIRIAT